MNKRPDFSDYFSRLRLIAVLAFLMVLVFGLLAYADTLYLKNGRSIEGIILKEDENEINLELNRGSMKFPKSQIASITRSSEEGTESIRQSWVVQQEANEAKIRQAQEKMEHEPKQAEFNKETGHMMVAATLNQKVKVSLILDTGASILALSNSVAASLGIDPEVKPENPAEVIEVILADGSKVTAKKIILESVSVQGSEVKNIEAAILPAQAQGLIAQDGLLGMSFLKHFTFKIDQKNDKLILEKL